MPLGKRGGSVSQSRPSQRFFTVFISVFSSSQHWESLGLLVSLKFTGALAGNANSWWFVILPLGLKLLCAALSGACALAIRPKRSAKKRPILTIEDCEHDSKDNPRLLGECQSR